MEKILVPVFHFRHKPLRHNAALVQLRCHPLTGFVSSIIIIKAEIHHFVSGFSIRKTGIGDVPQQAT